MRNRQKIAALDDAALIIFFIAALCLPVLGLALHLDTATANQEKRELAPFPSVRLDRHALAAFPEQFKLYFQDHFGFRNTLVRWQAIAKVKWLGVSTSSKVIVGKDGWLFYNGDDLSIESYRGMRPFTEEELARWHQILKSRRDWLARRGIHYLFTVAPDKHTIYPEYMPSTINRVRQESRLDQLLAYLKEHSDFQILDLRPALLEAKRHRRIYLRTDTHWNDYGAFVGYQVIIKEVAKSFPQMRPMTEADFDISTKEGTGTDLVDLLGLTGSIKEEFTILSPRKPFNARQDEHTVYLRSAAYEQKGSNLPRLVMFNDSFGLKLIPFIAEHFSRAVFVWDINSTPQFTESEHPDIVIQEMVERRLMVDPLANPDLSSGLPRP